MTQMQRFLIRFIILIFLQVKLSAQVIETTIAEDVLVKDDSLQEFNDDSLGFLNKTPLYFYYKSSLIYLNRLDTVSHYTFIQRNYSDQFLRIYNDKKILPASRIYAFTRNNRYYRSVNLGNRCFGFAEQIESGKMNLFCIDDLNSYGEVRTISQDANNSDYSNNLLVLDYDRRKYHSQNYLYFVSFDYNGQQLIPITPKELANQYLTVCPEAANYLKKVVGNPGSKTIRNLLAISFFASLFASIIAPYEINNEIAGENSKINYVHLYTCISGGAYLTYTIVHKKRIVKRQNMQEAVKMYNACVK